MRVRCSASADYRSNAVGDLELECTREGLRIALCGVCSYREGYAPGPPVRAGDVCVPWSCVYATRLGDRLQLSVDARNLPLNRFLLGDFSECPKGDSQELDGRRALPYGLAALGLIALGVGLALTRALPHARTFGTLGWAALVVAFALGAIAWRARTAPRMPPHVILDELCHELARYVPHHISSAAPTPAPRSLEPIALATLLPRSAVAIAIALAGATLAALVGSSAARPHGLRPEAAVNTVPSPSATSASTSMTDGSWRLGSAPDSPPSATSTFAEAVSSPTTAASAALLPAAPSGPPGAPALGDPCGCSRHESLPWQTPLPRVSPVLVSERSRLHEGHEHTEIELALVNDGNVNLHQLNVSVIFFEERAREQRGHWQTGERPSYFEGPLAPGQSIRWHIEGRGKSFDVIAPDLGALAPDGSDAAPADAFARLASSDGARALRLHAIRLLAFLGDARARGAADALRASASPTEAAYLDRLVAPPRALATCDLKVARESGRWSVDACVVNRSDRSETGLGLRLLAFDAPTDPLRPGVRAPSLLADYDAVLHGAFPGQSGRRVSLSALLSIEPGRLPRAFELEVAREEAPP